MRTLGAFADKMLALVVPQGSASAQSCACIQTCYCRGGLRYARFCNCCAGYCAGSCQVVGTC